MANPKPLRVFVDSDVIISSLISTSGAAFTLLHDTKGIELYVSNFSISELEKVVSRLHLESNRLHETISAYFATVEICLPYEEIQLQFAEYTRDTDDTHIVAGTKESKATFLISYNIRHFEAEKLTQDFQITLLTPGLFLQYLRSL